MTTRVCRRQTQPTYQVIPGDRRNATLSNVSRSGDAAISWVYALAVNRGEWSSDLIRVECLLDVNSSPDRPVVSVDVYRQTSSSVTLTWRTIVCDTLVVRSYQLQYSPTEHIAGVSTNSYSAVVH